MNLSTSFDDSEQLFRLAFERCPVGLSLTSIAGHLRVNRVFGDMLGYTVAELDGKDGREITHAEDVGRSEEASVALLAGEREDRFGMLKREVNELCHRLGETARYASQQLSEDRPGHLGTKATSELRRSAGPGRGSEAST
jgi:PAS domain S-box-containing protein